MDSHRTVAFPSLISIIIVFIILESTTTIDARELRPSDHGLEYYYEPGESSSEMTSFFGPPSSNELTSTSSSSSSSPSRSTLPSAVKSPMKSSKGRNDHVMTHVLVVGSLVCGLSGVALIVASALIYFRGYPKLQNSCVDCNQIHTNNTK